MKDFSKYKAIITSGFSLFFSFCLLLTVSFAWFSMSDKTSISSGGIKVEMSANLQISDTTSFTGQSSITLYKKSKSLLPSTHGGSSESNLKRIKDTIKIDKGSGLSNVEATDSDYTDVVYEENSEYYVEHTVYISSSGKEMRNANLVVRIEKIGNSIVYYHNAASIDFYVDGEYKGTLNLAGLSLENDIGYTGLEKTELMLLENGTIPYQYSEEGERYLTIKMVCYFDGALRDSDTSTFVTSNNLDTSEFNIKITYDAMN